MQGATVSKSKLQQKELDQLNTKLQNYKKLSPDVQAQVRRNVIGEVNAQRHQFREKLDDSKADLKRLNLILGATGAGKSTLFNYLNGFPLIIKEGVDKNGKKDQKIRLDVDRSKNPQNTKIAPIGHGFVSETTIPNFSKSRNSNVTYVDCAGEFDSRDILQSIINSYFKYQLAMEAQEVKLTIVINYNDIHNNRGTTFKQILKEVGNFIGLWQSFLKSQSISLVITGVDLSQINDPKIHIKQTLETIARDVKDLGLFKPILQNIAQRQAIAIFAAPERQYRTITDEKGRKKTQKFIPEGQPYNPDSDICSPEIISKTLDQTKFMKKQPGLFLHNLQSNAQYIVNAICEGTIEEIKAEVMNAIMMATINKKQGPKEKKPITIQQFNSQKQALKEKINSLSSVKEISQIINIFQVKRNFLNKYQSLRQDLNEFLKISNIPNIDKKIVEVAKDITIFLREKIQKIDKNALDCANKRYQSMQQEISVLKDQQKRLEKERAHDLEMKEIDAKNNLQIKKLQIKQQKSIADNQMKIAQIQMKTSTQIKVLELKAEQKKIQMQGKKEEMKIQNQYDLRKEEQKNTFGKVAEVLVQVGKTGVQIVKTILTKQL